ncbi:competence type IV pilus minor pilin ComGE [uncultured Anaerococcus sp.]|uniref:competence type IV pilus minor pilin ComGE n=1 Tax=uncultured Anaerococcus sp. TaxID=293428 RepID=UPI00260A6476|nr:competence type IV pilus minor pilin ComGE [uncultured Anaerococcus sp.]
MSKLIRPNINKRQGFTLIECLIALAFLSIIVVSLLPSLNKISSFDYKNKQDTKLVYALEEAIERGKDMEVGPPQKININGYLINLDISNYDYGMKLIRASYGSFHLDLVR